MDYIKEAESILPTQSFESFCSEVNNGFASLLILTELQKSGNTDLIEILNTVENGR
jgi:hypothetical protein